MHVVVPLGVEAAAACRPRRDQARIVEVALGDERQRSPQVRGQPAGLDGQILEKMGGGVVDERVDGVESERVDVELAEPPQRVADDVAAHLAAVRSVQVDAAAPGVGALRQVRAVPVEVVPRRSEVVVDGVEDHAETAGVARVDEGLQPVRSTVALVHRVPEDAIVSPVVGSVEPLTGISSTKSTPTPTRWSSRSTAAAKVPSGVNVPTCNS